MGDEYLSVPELYAGKSVFITGGAGYLGKVLIEKLLYSCPKVDKVYLLLRDRNNISASQRLRNIFKLPIFSRLKAVRPNDLDKIVLINGDLRLPYLNMGEDDMRTVTENVSIVIHIAASIKFNEPLGVSLNVNYEGTENMLSVSHLMKKIEAFVYISTAYSNTDKHVIEERIYPPPAPLDVVYNFAKITDVDDATLMKFLNGRPNAYTFSKAMAENLVAKTHGNLPVVIIRPSIVAPSKAEPVQGWVDNWFGATGLLTFIAKGICRAVYTDDSYCLDLIPVDYVCNLTLVAATRAVEKKLLVYNSCTGETNPITIAKLSELYIKEAVKNKFNSLPYPNFMVRTKRLWIVKMVTYLSFFTAYTADLFLKITFQKPRFIRILQQAIVVRNVLEYFTKNTWIMRTSRTLELSASLSHEDSCLFPFNPNDICWEEYIPTYFNGVYKYLIRNTKSE